MFRLTKHTVKNNKNVFFHAAMGLKVKRIMIPESINQNQDNVSAPK